MSTPVPPSLLEVHRHPERGDRDPARIADILDAGLLCHLGIVLEGRPVVLPTLYGRDGDHLILHGSAAARSLRGAQEGLPVCVTVTIVDGIVLAPTTFNHSANYRSVVVHGTATEVTEPAAKTAALEVLTEHVAPGRWAACPPPTPQELRATTVLTLPLSEAVSKVREGGTSAAPGTVPSAWLGVVPIVTVFGDPQPHEATPAELSAPTWRGDLGAPVAPRAV